MLRWHLEVDMAKKPPFTEAFAKIYSPEEPPGVSIKRTVEPDSLIATAAIFQWLSDLESMTFDTEPIFCSEIVPATRRIFVFHPMDVNAFIIHGVVHNCAVALEIDRRLTVFSTSVRALRTPSAGVPIEFPSNTKLPIVWPSRTHGDIVTGYLVPILWSVIIPVGFAVVE